MRQDKDYLERLIKLEINLKSPLTLLSAPI